MKKKILLTIIIMSLIGGVCGCGSANSGTESLSDAFKNGVK